jgi:hypothetical protein
MSRNQNITMLDRSKSVAFKCSNTEPLARVATNAKPSSNADEPL